MGRGAAIGCGPLLVAGLLALVFGVDPGQVLQGLEGTGGAPVEQTAPEAPADETRAYVQAVLGETEDVWEDVYPAFEGRPYQEPELVLFSGAVPTACGTGQAQMGPFYCPRDQRVYVDPGFFNTLARMGGRGDFAPAYVIAHEVGHHIQNLTGVLGATQRARGRSDVSVAVELQADCLAGVWAHHADRERDILDESDVQEGINAARSVGDDAIRGGPVPYHQLSHGTSQQRAEWFVRGLRSGRMDACNTFG